MLNRLESPCFLFCKSGADGPAGLTDLEMVAVHLMNELFWISPALGKYECMRAYQANFHLGIKLRLASAVGSNFAHGLLVISVLTE